MTAEINFTSLVTDAARQHALDCFPHESCGVVMNDTYWPMENVHPEAHNAFRLNPAEYAALSKAGTIQAVVHSHCDRGAFGPEFRPGLDKDCPSQADMEGQLATGLPWGIVLTNGQRAALPFWWGDFILDTPLKDQPFRHGVQDCYTAIRKWYWQARGVKLPEFPRSHAWWNKDQSLYETGFAEAGFERVQDEPREGDVFLMKLRSPVVNHGLVYLGRGEIFHHVTGRISRQQAGSQYLSKCEVQLRYVG